MSHVDDATLHELVDDELAPAARHEVEAHLASCDDCARRFAEAAAMARQVVSLLTALDEAARPTLVVTPVAPAPNRRSSMLRRISIAASVMLVAGVSYEVGTRGTQGPAGPAAALTAALTAASESIALPQAMPAADSQRAELKSAERARVSAPLVSAPSAVAPSPASAPMRTAESREAAPPAARADAVLEREASVQDARVAASDRVAPGLRPRALADAASRAPAPAPAPANVAVAPASMRAAADESTGPELVGYAMVEERSAPAVPAITRRRYVSGSGTALLLTIMRGAGQGATETDVTMAPQYVVSSSNGRSTVRWQAQGNTYELQGALPADSLKTLATQLR